MHRKTSDHPSSTSLSPTTLGRNDQLDRIALMIDRSKVAKQVNGDRLCEAPTAEPPRDIRPLRARAAAFYAARPSAILR